MQVGRAQVIGDAPQAFGAFLFRRLHAHPAPLDVGRAADDRHRYAVAAGGKAMPLGRVRQPSGGQSLLVLGEDGIGETHAAEDCHGADAR